MPTQNQIPLGHRRRYTRLMALPAHDVVLIIETLWLLAAFYWLIRAFHNKKTIYRQSVLQRLAYFLPVVIAVIIIQQFPQLLIPFFDESLAVQLTGILLTAGGLAFSFWARIVLGRNWSGLVTLKQDHELIQSGPYAFVRHPIYTGLVTAILGTILALLPSPAGILYLFLIILAFSIKLRQEERLMLQQFPDAYAAYKQKVKTRFIPFIY
jgi:protein-S-isoprenylcysteine O-methyltransferase Ste14